MEEIKTMGFEVNFEKLDKSTKLKEREEKELNNSNAIADNFDSADTNKSSKFFSDTEIKFKFDKDSSEIVIQILDKNTGELIREIPPENFLKQVDGLSETEIIGISIDKLA